MTWRRGSHVAVRGRPERGIGYTFPAIVIQDTLQLIALFQPSGTLCKARGGPRGGPGGRYLLEWDGTHRDVLFSFDTVHAHVPGDEYWVIRGWDGTGHVGWYVNLAAPWKHTRIGFDTLDHTLDIDVADDLSGWSWKDEDGLAWMIEQGLYSPEKGEEIRAAGLAAVSRMEERHPPFHDDWSDLRPDPSWRMPELQVAWNAVEG